MEYSAVKLKFIPKTRDAKQQEHRERTFSLLLVCVRFHAKSITKSTEHIVVHFITIGMNQVQVEITCFNLLTKVTWPDHFYL